MHTIDLNCDMGEGMGTDAAMVPYITSASIACGGHYGDVQTIAAAIQLCNQYGVAVGAHPSYPDTINFGRHSLALPMDGLLQSLFEQISLFQSVCGMLGVTMHHIKPHGALYNDMANDKALATAFAQWVRQHWPPTVVYMLSGSPGSTILQQHGLTVAQEAFADRTYTDAGTLTPRSQPQALHGTAAAAVAQVLNMVHRQRVQSTGGQWLPLVAETICLHSDTPGAADMAATLHGQLTAAGISIKTCHT
jgi:5-oxoprolinase (ATP-hydrolysing) subunit A